MERILFWQIGIQERRKCNGHTFPQFSAPIFYGGKYQIFPCDTIWIDMIKGWSASTWLWLCLESDVENSSQYGVSNQASSIYNLTHLCFNHLVAR